MIDCGSHFLQLICIKTYKIRDKTCFIESSIKKLNNFFFKIAKKIEIEMPLKC